ncbi:NUDIX hydrolase [Streptomyces sp. NPDC059477]|uniref:NUDIX hydrolase n=1 Tax=Streptomyces sp. NPDC059477 TaxID=3346847 RepID=UPI0036998502
MSAADEILDIVDERDRVIGQAPRGAVYARGLRHRCVFVQVRDGAGRIFVHRRTATKLVFPALYDMFVGGVVGTGESYDDAASREAEEELGVSGLPAPTYLFKFLYDDGAGQTWWSAVYEVRCELPVRPQVEEVAWHDFLPESELESRLGAGRRTGQQAGQREGAWEWVPDGVAAYQRLREHRSAGDGRG